MPTYNFTSDLRISMLPSRIETAANEIISHQLSSDKSLSNNRATLAFYFNLIENTNTIKLAANGAITEIVRNFVTKFQYPNTYTSDLFFANINANTFIAPLREIIKLLAYQVISRKIDNPFLTFDEIRYFIFSKPEDWKDASPSFYDSILDTILTNRSNGVDYTEEIEHSLDWKQYERQSRELISIIPYACDAFKVGGGKISLSMPEPLSESFSDVLHFLASTLKCKTLWIPSDKEYNSTTKQSYIDYMDINGDVEYCRQSLPEPEFIYNKCSNLPLQQIVFGAPGTGKSHGINSNANISESNSIRTTFHPDSDYSSFVGCYKPTKKEKRSIIIPSDKLIEDAKNITGVANQVKYLCDNADSFISAANELNISRNKLIWESFGWHNETYFASFLELIQKERADFGGEITYEFCPQAFTNAYVNAWKNLDEPYYLIIEEINRGNCAQIFGDIFQLLDRDENGFSSYKITPDQDLANYLCSQFKDVDIDDEDIKSGCKMQLPNNLHIWATMNTSDQSLFPIDSAFKRRWDWKYMPIDYTDLGHYISCEDKKYSWSDFLEKVNEHIEATTQSEDKKLGYWFLARNGHDEITMERFVSKVIFYLWNDIFKDFATAGNSIFKDEYSKFHKFFDYSGNAKSDVVKKFLDNLGVISTNAEDENDESDSAESGALKFSLNGSQPISQRRLAQAALEEYLKNHSNYTAQQVIDDWKPLSNVPNFITTESEYLAQVAKAPSWENRAAKITLSNEEVVYISLQGWIPDATWAFVNAINAKDWGINIKRAEA